MIGFLLAAIYPLPILAFIFITRRVTGLDVWDAEMKRRENE